MKGEERGKGENGREEKKRVKNRGEEEKAVGRDRKGGKGERLRGGRQENERKK